LAPGQGNWTTQVPERDRTADFTPARRELGEFIRGRRVTLRHGAHVIREHIPRKRRGAHPHPNDPQWGGGKSHDFGPSRFSIASRLEDGEALIIHDHLTKIVGSRLDR
jgi:hypothetical protein